MSNKTISPLAIIGYVTTALVGAWLALNVWTYVPVGEKKVEVNLGQVTGTVLDNGLHIVNPVSSFDSMNTQNQTLDYTKIGLPTQDRMDNYGAVTVKFRVLDTGLATIREDYGSQERFLEKTLWKDVPDAIKAEARLLKDSADLADNNNIEDLKRGALKRLKAKLGDKIDIEEVLVYDVTYDEKVKAQIIATKQRQEQEKRQLSELRIKETKYQEQVAEAAAKAESAEHAKTERMALADAKLYEAQKEAEAIAEKGEALSKNPGLIKYMEAEAKLIEATNWDGKRVLTHQIVATPLTTIK